VVTNTRLATGIHRLEVRAPRIAEIARPGQFVIVRAGPRAERIPLTIAAADRDRGTITLVIQAVGKSTGDLVALLPRSVVQDVAGPLGRPTDLVEGGHAVCVGGGVGTAVVLPIARALSAAGTRVTSVVGARSAAQLVLEAELRAVGRLVVCTDDGSRGRRGLVTDALADVLAAGRVDVVYAAGPVPMMRAVADTTRPVGVRTIVSLNPIMVDGTGMCGGCRVHVGDQTRFACVDGPEFDAFDVDFDELADRLTTYAAWEAIAAQHAHEAAS
jgi:ferredoxin/flavodoxin---NADP+ reductase